MFKKNCCKYKRRFLGVSLRRLLDTKLDNGFLTDKNEFDKDEVDKNDAKSHMIASLVTSAQQLPSFLAGVLLNMVLIHIY